MKALKKWLGAGCTLALLVGNVYAYGSLSVMGDWDIGGGLFAPEIDLIASASEQQVSSSYIDKIAIRYYLLSNSGSVITKNYNYELDSDYVEAYSNGVDLSGYADYVSYEGEGAAYYTNGRDNLEYFSADIEVPYQNVRSIEVTKDVDDSSMEELAQEYVQYLVDNNLSSSVDITEAYRFTDLEDKKKFGNLRSIYMDLVMSSNIGDFAPYIYLNPEKDFGMVVMKDKDGEYEVRQLEATVQNSDSGQIERSRTNADENEKTIKWSLID